MKTALQFNAKFYAAAFLAVAIALAGVVFALRTNAQTSDGSLSGSVMTASATSTDAIVLRDRINDLEDETGSLRAELASLRAEIAQLRSAVGAGGWWNGTTTVPLDAPVRIEPQNASVRAGTSVDFTARGFWPDEPVTITNDGGTILRNARADGGGNFSTGSMSVSTSTGAHSYTFRGAWSGKSKTVNLTVTQ